MTLYNQLEYPESPFRDTEADKAEAEALQHMKETRPEVKKLMQDQSVWSEKARLTRKEASRVVDERMGLQPQRPPQMSRRPTRTLRERSDSVDHYMEEHNVSRDEATRILNAQDDFGVSEDVAISAIRGADEYQAGATKREQAQATARIRDRGRYIH